MLNGALKIVRCDNGWILNWYESRDSFSQPGDPKCEVYGDAYAGLCRAAEIVGMKAGPAAARALLGAAEAAAHTDAATDADVAELAAPNTPPTVPLGD